MYWEERLKSTQQPIVQEVSRQLSVLQINDAFEAKTLPDCSEWFSARYSTGRPDTEVQQMYYEVHSLLPAEEQPSNLPPPQGQKRKVSWTSPVTPSPTKGRPEYDLNAFLNQDDLFSPELPAGGSDDDMPDENSTPGHKRVTSSPVSTEKQEETTGKTFESVTLVKDGQDLGSGDASAGGGKPEDKPEDATEGASQWPAALDKFNSLGCKLEIVPSFGPCVISIVRCKSSLAPACECDGALVSLQEHAAAKKRRGQDVLVQDFSKGQVLAIVKFSTTVIASKMLKNMVESERSSVLYEVGLKSGTRILLVPKGEVDNQTAEATDVSLGTAGKLLQVEGKPFRSTDTYLFKADSVPSSQFLFLVNGFSFSFGYEVVPVVSQDAGIKVLGLAVCAKNKITVYREKFMPLCEIEEEGEGQKQAETED